MPAIPGLAPEGPAASPGRLLVPSLWRMLLGMVGGLGVGVVVILIANPHIARDVQDAQRASVQPVYLLAALALRRRRAAHRRLVAARTRARVPAADRAPPRGADGSLESHLIGGATSFGGFEIPYQIVMLRRGDLSGSQAMSVVIFKGLVHTLILAVVALLSLLPWVDSPISPLQRWLLLGATARPAARVGRRVGLAAAALWTRLRAQEAAWQARRARGGGACLRLGQPPHHR